MLPIRVRATSDRPRRRDPKNRSMDHHPLVKQDREMHLELEQPGPTRSPRRRLVGGADHRPRRHPRVRPPSGDRRPCDARRRPRLRCGRRSLVPSEATNSSVSPRRARGPVPPRTDAFTHETIGKALLAYPRGPGVRRPITRLTRGGQMCASAEARRVVGPLDGGERVVATVIRPTNACRSRPRRHVRRMARGPRRCEGCWHRPVARRWHSMVARSVASCQVARRVGRLRMGSSSS